MNAANRYLLSGGGVCGAIFSKAGYKELTDACSRIKTLLNDGDAMLMKNITEMILEKPSIIFVILLRYQ